MILVRRLEVQLAEMNKADASELPTTVDDMKASTTANSAGTATGRAETPLAENEDDKERAIAKAALTIAELSQYPFAPPSFCLVFFFSGYTIHVVRGGDELIGTTNFTATLLNASAKSDAPGAVDEGSKEEQNAGDHIPLSSIKAVAAHLPFVDAAHARVTSDMEAMVITGLGTLVGLPNMPDNRIIVCR